MKGGSNIPIEIIVKDQLGGGQKKKKKTGKSNKSTPKRTSKKNNVNKSAQQKGMESTLSSIDTGVKSKSSLKSDSKSAQEKAMEVKTSSPKSKTKSDSKGAQEKAMEVKTSSPKSKTKSDSKSAQKKAMDVKLSPTAEQGAYSPESTPIAVDASVVATDLTKGNTPQGGIVDASVVNPDVQQPINVNTDVSSQKTPSSNLPLSTLKIPHLQFPLAGTESIIPANFIKAPGPLTLSPKLSKGVDGALNLVGDTTEGITTFFKSAKKLPCLKDLPGRLIKMLIPKSVTDSVLGVFSFITCLLKGKIKSYDFPNDILCDWGYLFLFVMAAVPILGGVADLLIVIKAILSKHYFLAIITIATSLTSLVLNAHVFDLGLIFKVFYYLDSISYQKMYEDKKTRTHGWDSGKAIHSDFISVDKDDPCSSNFIQPLDLNVIRDTFKKGLKKPLASITLPSLPSRPQDLCVPPSGCYDPHGNKGTDNGNNPPRCTGNSKCYDPGNVPIAPSGPLNINTGPGDTGKKTVPSVTGPGPAPPNLLLPCEDPNAECKNASGNIIAIKMPNADHPFPHCPINYDCVVPGDTGKKPLGNVPIAPSGPGGVVPKVLNPIRVPCSKPQICVDEYGTTATILPNSKKYDYPHCPEDYKCDDPDDNPLPYSPRSPNTSDPLTPNILKKPIDEIKKHIKKPSNIGVKEDIPPDALKSTSDCLPPDPVTGLVTCKGLPIPIQQIRKRIKK